MLLLSERCRWFPFNQHKGLTVLIAVAIVTVVLLFMVLWFVASVFFRLRFQFSLRTLLVLFLAVAFPCSWLAVELQQARRQKEAVKAILRAGACGSYDCGPDAEPPGPAWLASLLGDDFYFDVRFVMFPNGDVSDPALEPVKEFSQLRELLLSHTQVADAGLMHLQGLGHLQVLDLDYTQVTGTGLEHLRALSRLQTLYLNNTRVTDAGLEHLTELAQLRELYLRGTKVTDNGVKRLQRALPRCQITR